MRTRILLIGLAALALPAAAAVAQTPLNASMYFSYFTGSAGTPQVIFTDTLGSAASFGPRLVATISSSSLPAPAPPYRVRIEITRGFSNAVPLSLPAGAVCQPATGGGNQALLIDCVLNNQVVGTPFNLIYALDAGDLAAFGGHSAEARMTVDYDAFPLPDPPQCVIGAGQTGCVLRPVLVHESKVGLTSLSTVDPMTIGVNSLIRVDHWVIGYDSSRITTTDIDLPPELEYVGVQNLGAPFHTCTAAPFAGGERVSCDGNLRHPSGDGAIRTGYCTIGVRPRPGVAPPGPLPGVAQSGNAAPPAPGNCAAVPNQDTCADLSFGLVSPPVVDLRFGDWSVPEPWLMLGRAQGPLFVRYRNAGGAASANPVRILAQLPPGFSLVSGSSIEGPVSCTGTGDIEDGQTVTCLRSSLPANSTSPSLSLTVRGDLEFSALTGNVAVMAITDGAISDTQALLACAADPELPGCRWLPFNVRHPCPGGPTDVLYCDDFELFVLPQD